MKLFETDKKESTETRMLRWRYNLWPCLWCTGGQVDFISSDYKEMHVSLKLQIRTLNRVGTIFGGSIYSSIDPHYMLLFMKILGKDYVVWDKAASIKFLRPARDKIKCRFLLTDELVENVKKQLAEKGEYSFDLPLRYEDDEGKMYAAFKKTIYVATKDFYEKKLQTKRNKK